MAKDKWNSRIVGYADINPNELLANPFNWRIHTKAQQDALSGVLSEVGWVQAVVVNKTTGHVVDGHLRVSLALSRDEATIPVVLVELTEDEEKLTLATIDPIAAMAVADKEQLDELLKGVNSDSAAVQELIAGIAEANGMDYGKVPPSDTGAAMDRAAELQAKWNTARGQIWQVGRHRVMCGDSTSAEDVGALFEDARAEMVWTDPPYGVSVGDKNKMLNAIAPSNRVEENLTNDTLDEAGLVAMLAGAFDVAMQFTLSGGAWYVAAPPGPLHVLFGQVLKDRSIWHQTIQWVKNNATFSPMGVDYHWRAEPIFYGWLPNGAHRYYGGRKQDTVWEIDRPVKSPEHPTMKPVELVARAIENSSRPNEIVYDPFLGSGTTAVASEQLNRIAYGMDIEPKYVAVTLERLSGMGLTPELVKHE